MYNKIFRISIVILIVAFVLGLAGLLKAAVTVNLGTADGFAILAGSGITNTGTTTITGDIGSFSTVSITGSPTVIGTNHAGDEITQGAKTDLATAFGNANQTCTQNLTGQDLGGLVLTPGVYCFDSSAQLTGTLTLNGQGNPNAIFVFKMGSTLTTASNSIVTLTNSAQACNVFWRVGSSATLGTDTNLKGNILALTSITLTTGVNVGGRVLAQNGAVTLDTNTITKATCAGILRVIKSVVNDNGGSEVAGAFTINITGTNVSSASFTGVETPGTTTTLDAGSYSVDEDAFNGYTKTLGANCSGSIAAGETKICTITNNDNTPSLTLNKIVVNNSGGAAAESAWTLTATGSTTISGPGASGSTDVVSGATFLAGTYILSESAGPADYASSTWSCVKNSGVPVIGSSITLGLGDTAICTIINDDIAPVVLTTTSTITVIKTVINDNGRSKIDTDFPLFVNGVSVTSGVPNVFSAPASYTISETVDSNYTQSFSVDCPNGIVALTAGVNKICIITNNDIAPASSGGGSSYTPPVPPLIDVVKVPSPLSLPTGPSAVTYTYTLHNIGTVPVTNITMVGDTCSPIVLISGDTNGDSKLDVNETWVHTCSTTLTETHTNTVVTKGWANGISATDIASATVVVGVPVVPPLIHVTKIPNPLMLLATGGVVTYTEKITNPGTVSLSNVRLVDDKCAPINYISGDTNGDSKLDSSETWIYTCKTNLTKTTMNTAIASGEANGLTVRDIAIATVVVADVIPALPATGITPDKINTLWNIVIIFGIFMAVPVSLFILIKKYMN